METLNLAPDQDSYSVVQNGGSIRAVMNGVQGLYRGTFLNNARRVQCKWEPLTEAEFQYLLDFYNNSKALGFPPFLAWLYADAQSPQLYESSFVPGTFRYSVKGLSFSVSAELQALPSVYDVANTALPSWWDCDANAPSLEGSDYGGWISTLDTFSRTGDLDGSEPDRAPDGSLWEVVSGAAATDGNAVERTSASDGTSTASLNLGVVLPSSDVDLTVDFRGDFPLQSVPAFATTYSWAVLLRNITDGTQDGVAINWSLIDGDITQCNLLGGSLDSLATIQTQFAGVVPRTFRARLGANLISVYYNNTPIVFEQATAFSLAAGEYEIRIIFRGGSGSAADVYYPISRISLNGAP